MPSYHRTRGVVLRCIDFSESSQVAAILTPDAGQIHVLAKGTKRPRKDGRGALDVLDYCDMVLSKRATGELHLLTDWGIRESFLELRKNLRRLWYACYAAEVALITTSENAEDGALCDHLIELLRSLNRGAGEQLALLSYIARALRVIGMLPAVANCAQCGLLLFDSTGKGDAATGPVRFSASAGGTICANCAVKIKDSIPISRGSLAILNLILKDFVTVPLRIAASQANEITRALNEQIQYHVGKRLKSERFLREV